MKLANQFTLPHLSSLQCPRSPSSTTITTVPPAKVFDLPPLTCSRLLSDAEKSTSLDFLSEVILEITNNETATKVLSASIGGQTIIARLEQIISDNSSPIAKAIISRDPGACQMFCLDPAHNREPNLDHLASGIFGPDNKVVSGKENDLVQCLILSSIWYSEFNREQFLKKLSSSLDLNITSEDLGGIRRFIHDQEFKSTYSPLGLSRISSTPDGVMLYAMLTDAEYSTWNIPVTNKALFVRSDIISDLSELEVKYLNCNERKVHFQNFKERLLASLAFDDFSKEGQVFKLTSSEKEVGLYVSKKEQVENGEIKFTIKISGTDEEFKILTDERSLRELRDALVDYTIQFNNNNLANMVVPNSQLFEFISQTYKPVHE